MYSALKSYDSITLDPQVKDPYTPNNEFAPFTGCLCSLCKLISASTMTLVITAYLILFVVIFSGQLIVSIDNFNQNPYGCTFLIMAVIFYGSIVVQLHFPSIKFYMWVVNCIYSVWLVAYGLVVDHTFGQSGLMFLYLVNIFIVFIACTWYMIQLFTIHDHNPSQPLQNVRLSSIYINK